MICNDEIVGRTPVPRCVDSDRVRDNHYTLAGSLGSQNLLKHIGIRWESTDDDVGLKTVKHGSELLLQSSQSSKFRVVISLVIEPVINHSPGVWRMINQREITSAHQLVDSPVGIGKQIPQFYGSLLRSNASQPLAHSSGCAVVTLSEAGGQDQYFLLHQLGETDCDQSQKQMEVTRESRDCRRL